MEAAALAGAIGKAIVPIGNAMSSKLSICDMSANWSKE